MKIKHNYILLLAVSFFLLWSCQSNNDIPVSETPQMIKLAAPVRLNLDSTTIVLADYLLRPAEIDSFRVHPGLEATISADSACMTIRTRSGNFPGLSELRIWSEGYPYTILLEKSTKIRFRYAFDPGTGKYKQVQVKGQMNEWTPSAGRLFEREGKWHIDFSLFPGKYQYKLILDGREISDPANPDSVSNGTGGYNSLLTVGNLLSPDLPQLHTSSAEDGRMIIGLKNSADTIFVLWENHLLDNTFWRRDTSGIVISIPRKARDFNRSSIRVWAVNGTGMSNMVLVPLANGRIMDDPKMLTRSDHEAMILYFMMVDRFKNGSMENDKPVADPDLSQKVNYIGGDLEGITQVISSGYFSKLGINAIWISPVTQNPLVGFAEYPAPHRKFSGYHGYWPVTLTSVDSRFGSSRDMHNLVREAHSNNMNILLDFVSHHVHQDYPLLRDHPDWVTPVDLPGGRKNIRIWDEQRLTTWFDSFLPTFDLTKPEVAELVSDSAAFWITEYEFDGFRHDAAKHVPENYWRLLTKKLNDQVSIPVGRKTYQIGETFGSRDLIGSYINPGMLDAQFDFNLYWDARLAFSTDKYSFRDLNYSLRQSFSYYGEHHLMGNITGNQDMPRFISFAGGALSFSEDNVEAGWKRDIQVTDTAGYRKLASLEAFNMTIPGVPVIYYGDEFGMPGAGDPDNRRMMKFDGLNKHEQALLETTSKLAKLRGNSLALVYGDFTTLKVTDKVYIYVRSYFDKAVIVIFNKDKSAREVEIEIPGRFRDATFVTNFDNKMLAANGKVVLKLKGYTFEVLTN